MMMMMMMMQMERTLIHIPLEKSRKGVAVVLLAVDIHEENNGMMFDSWLYHAEGYHSLPRTDEKSWWSRATSFLNRWDQRNDTMPCAIPV